MKIQNTPADVYEEISLREIVAPLFRRTRSILIAYSTVFTLILLAALAMGPIYTAHTVVLVNRERQDPMVTPEATTQAQAGSMPVTEEEINSEVELLLSRDVLEQVVTANGLDQPKENWLTDWTHPSENRDQRMAHAVKKLAKSIKVKPVAKTDLIDIAYSSANPQLAHSVLTTLGDAYIKKHVSVHRPSGSSQLFSSEVDSYRNQLQASEAKLANFSKDNGTAAPDVQRTNLALQVATSIGLLHQAEQIVAADTERIEKDHEQLNSLPERSPTVQSSAQADKLISDLQNQLLLTEARRASLAIKYESTYPLVREADQEIAQAKTAIRDAESTRYVTEVTDRDPTFELIREDLAKALTDQAAQKATVTATKASIADMQAHMVSLDHAALIQGDLLRDERANESNYLLYLSKREQERTSDALDLKRIANVVIAVPPAIPVLPAFSWPFIFLVAFAASAFASVVAAYVLDYFDPSFHNPSQVAEKLGIPLVIAVPMRHPA